MYALPCFDGSIFSLVAKNDLSTSEQIACGSHNAMPSSSSCVGLPAAVTELTDSDGDSDAVPSAEFAMPKKKSKKRHRDDGSKPLKERLLDKRSCLDVVAKRCGGKCRRECLAKFRAHHLLEDLMTFRRQWSEFHKLDADRLATWPKPSLA